MYYALVHSYARYGICAWGNASKTTMQPLTSLINRAVRIMTFAPFGNIDVDSIYQYLDILKLPDISSLNQENLPLSSRKAYYQLATSPTTLKLETKMSPIHTTCEIAESKWRPSHLIQHTGKGQSNTEEQKFGMKLQMRLEVALPSTFLSRATNPF